jgi:transposase
MAIWQDLVDTYGFAAGYQSVRRFVRKLQGNTTPEVCAVIETAASEEAQVDYGEGPMVRDPQTGKYRRTRLFVLTLGCSRKSVRLLVFPSSSQTWAELHEQAFRRLGGPTKTVVLDFVAGHKIVILLPTALCGLGRARAVECGAQA